MCEISSGSTKFHVWIGLNDLKADGHFRWSDNKVFYYKNWNTGEPNNHGGPEDCTEIAKPDAGKAAWNDKSCTQLNPFVCKVPLVW